jgi:ABC-type transporter Mla subunit MlaD
MMKVPRNEIRTGLLVVSTFAVLVAALLYLGAPGAFAKLHTYRIFFDNAAGIKPGADVMVAGRKVGQVRHIYSPMPVNSRPEPKYESLVEVRVEESACVYHKVRVQMVQLSMLGDSMIDFSEGEESSGLAPDGTTFIGERQHGLADAVPLVLDKLDPVLKKATATFDSLEKTSDNLSRITGEGGELPTTLVQFREFGGHLNELSSYGGPLRVSLENIQALTGEDGRINHALGHIEELTGPDGPLAKTLKNAERITGNKDIETAFRNFRQSSEKLNHTLRDVGPDLSATSHNLEQASDTVKRQPWRLIWPSTKDYDDDADARRGQTKARAIPVKSR